jgi:hypothetical protein
MRYLAICAVIPPEEPPHQVVRLEFAVLRHQILHQLFHRMHCRAGHLQKFAKEPGRTLVRPMWRRLSEMAAVVNEPPLPILLHF